VLTSTRKEAVTERVALHDISILGDQLSGKESLAQVARSWRGPNLTKTGEFAQSFAGGGLRLLGFIRATQGW
jgi:hypothetical protein